MEAKQDFLTAGGKEFHYIPCLNEDHAWIAGMAEIAEQHMIGWPTVLTPMMRDDMQKEAETSRQQALSLGARE
jgi:protoporphyrin/coproporphyrin ferrochelatase